MFHIVQNLSRDFPTSYSLKSFNPFSSSSTVLYCAILYRTSNKTSNKSNYETTKGGKQFYFNLIGKGEREERRESVAISVWKKVIAEIAFLSRESAARLQSHSKYNERCE